MSRPVKCFRISQVKFGYSEKATKFEKNLPLKILWPSQNIRTLTAPCIFIFNLLNNFIAHFTNRPHISLTFVVVPSTNNVARIIYLDAILCTRVIWFTTVPKSLVPPYKGKRCIRPSTQIKEFSWLVGYPFSSDSNPPKGDRTNSLGCASNCIIDNRGSWLKKGQYR